MMLLKRHLDVVHRILTNCMACKAGKALFMGKSFLPPG